MTKPPKCLITGVTLCLCNEGLVKPADLFSFRDVLIVNAAGDGERRVPGPMEKVIHFDEYHGGTFERRNVYVLEADLGALNEAAQEYINGSLS